MAAVVIAAGRCITTHDVLAVNLSLDGNVLSNRKSEDIIRVGQPKPIADRQKIIEQVYRSSKQLSLHRSVG